MSEFRTNERAGIGIVPNGLVKITVAVMPKCRKVGFILDSDFWILAPGSFLNKIDTAKLCWHGICEYVTSYCGCVRVIEPVSKE